MCITVFDIVFELGPTTRRIELSTLVKSQSRGDTEFRCVLLVAKKKKNPEDERKILLYRNIKKKMATSGQL